MNKIEVPPMCFSTEELGVDIAPLLALFKADLKWIAEHGKDRQSLTFSGF